MVLGAFCCDAAGQWLWSRPAGGRLRAAGAYAIWFGALGTLPAVVSGLALARGDGLGAGALRWHHLFVWPAFALTVGAAAWRWLVGGDAPRRVHATYLTVLGAATLLVL